MIILTGANTELSKSDLTGKTNTKLNFSFRAVINETVQKAIECGYKPVVYDLGSLGIGEPYYVEDETFATSGYYSNEVKTGYKSKSLFKPGMVRKCIEEHNEPTVYLDGDAKLCDSIDEVLGEDYDVGVTLRELSELESEWHQQHFEIVKFINAGVIIFNPTEATKLFLKTWEQTTEELGNDQMALNKLLCPNSYPDAYSVVHLNGVRVKYFPCKKYNFYYFNEGLESGIKIMHFKGPVRKFYPFNWKKRLYCSSIVPVKNKLSNLAKSIFK